MGLMLLKAKPHKGTQTGTEASTAQQKPNLLSLVALYASGLIRLDLKLRPHRSVSGDVCAITGN